MIQRIQTIYLFLAFISSGVMVFFFDLWNTNVDGVRAMDLLSDSDISLKFVPILFLISALLPLFTILKFSNRNLQMNLGKLTILINLILLGLFAYLILTLSGEAAVSKKDIGMFLPLISIGFILLANSAIKKDEDLVKSVDRLR
ncbi:MAG: DUF4293 domain-containing protein [Polaribacter sp.]